MGLKTVYVTRHGYRSNWVKDVPVPDPPTGIVGDPVLARHGEIQAEQLGDYIKTIEPRISRIYSSPFYRCLQTATPSAKRLDLPILVENGIGEWYERERASHPSPAPIQVLKGFFPLIDDKYKPLLVPSTEGEDIRELHERCQEALARIIRDVNTNYPDVEAILFVSHAAPKAALGPAFTGDHSTVIRTGTCSLDKYELKPGASGDHPGDWTMILNGYTDFLEKGEEMHWSFDNPFEPGSTEDIRAREKGQVKEAPTGDSKPDSDHSDMASVYIPLELGQVSTASVSTRTIISSQASFQVSGLESETPLFKIGETIYQGTWNQIIGTEVFTAPDGEIIGKSRERVVLQSQQVQYKSDDMVQGETLMEKIRKINESSGSPSTDLNTDQ